MTPESKKLIGQFAAALSNETIYGEGEMASMRRCREYSAKTAAARKALESHIERLEAAPAVSQKDGAAVECSDTACIRCVTGEGWCRNEPDNPYAALSWDQDEDPAATTASASTIKTWQERAGMREFIMPKDAVPHMVAEIADLRAALARAPLPAQENSNEALAGRTVSVDVSTCDDDAGNRIFAELTGETGSDGTTLIAIETSRNFAAPAQAGDARDAALFRKVVELGIQLHFEGGDGEDDAVWVNCLMKWADGDRLGATRELVEQEAKNLAAMSASQGQKGGAA